VIDDRQMFDQDILYTSLRHSRRLAGNVLPRCRYSRIAALLLRDMERRQICCFSIGDVQRIGYRWVVMADARFAAKWGSTS